jgi:hypothetical protein
VTAPNTVAQLTGRQFLQLGEVTRDTDGISRLIQRENAELAVDFIPRNSLCADYSCCHASVKVLIWRVDKGLWHADAAGHQPLQAA